MQLGIVEYYFIGINVIGFACALISTFLYSYTEDGQIDIIMTIVATIGGSIGITLELLLLDRLLKKEVMMSRVYVLCMSVIQLIIFLYIEGFHAKEINLNIINFFDKYRLVLKYLVVINTVAIIAYGMDKLAAIEHRSRIRIVTLLGIAIAGGSIGALIAMYAFRHKTHKDYFVIGVPLILITQNIVIFYCMNLGWF